MFMVCVGLVFGSKNNRFHIIYSFYHSIISTTEVDLHSDKSDSLRIGIVKPKNSQLVLDHWVKFVNGRKIEIRF